MNRLSEPVLLLTFQAHIYADILASTALSLMTECFDKVKPDDGWK